MKSKLILNRGNETVVIEKSSDILELIKKLSENESGKSFKISKLVEDGVENEIKGYIYEQYYISTTTARFEYSALDSHAGYNLSV